MKVLLMPLYYHLYESDPLLFDGMVEAFNGVMYNGNVQDAIAGNGHRLAKERFTYNNWAEAYLYNLK